MGIDVDSKVMIGARVGDMQDLDKHDDILEWADDNNLSYASPDYDCDRCDYILGVELTELDIDSADVEKKICDGKSRFKELTGCDAKIIITNDIW